jgi:hypothetical protein
MKKVRCEDYECTGHETWVAQCFDMRTEHFLDCYGVLMVKVAGDNWTPVMPCDTGMGCWCEVAAQGNCAAHY